ncbi:ribose-5-phosphate isomerase RpiA [Aerococcaceae bacterium DSM 111022]|nr:ribose-5-phosphate isomerase RpiA [Aerococcaceae bacterium DSM 111022]
MIDQAKMVAGRKAVDYITSGMTVGLGTGSTAYYFIDELGRRIRTGQLENIQAVATSKRSQEQAESLGINVVSLDMVEYIDVLVDGADETTYQGHGIKGGGGALLYEKIVAMASKKNIWIITPDKMVETLGAFPLPIEVIPFGSLRLFDNLRQMGLNPTFRKLENDSIFVTDAGNYIFDLHLQEIPAPHQLALELDRMVGVIEHGLFLDLTDLIIVGYENGETHIHHCGQE